MNYILFDDEHRVDLLPMTFTRPAADIRFGILTIREKWEKRLGESFSTYTEAYLSGKYPLSIADDNLLINGRFCPDDQMIEEIGALEKDQKLVDGDSLIALRLSGPLLNEIIRKKIPLAKTDIFKVRAASNRFVELCRLWEVFKDNGSQIIQDYALLTRGRRSEKLNDTNTVLGDDVFVENGARVSCAILNSETGPIYIGKNAEVMEGSVIRGPFALCEGATIKLGAKIYGPTTIGPFSKAGGEINNSVIFGYSNKGHDGFLGNSVIGEWCNIGADSNNSNLKNNYTEVGLWSYREDRFVKTGLQFCGLIMADHSKCGINTMFNTGTVVGVFANVFGAGFPRNFIPSFSWGGPQGFSEYKLQKAIEVGKLVMERRDRKLDQEDRNILSKVFEMTEKYRSS